MNLLNAYKSGFLRAIDSKRIVTFIYGITFFLGITIAIPFQQLLSDTFSHRAELNKMLSDFNFTIYTDFMANYGDILKPLTNILFWFGVLYFFFTIFFAGGIFKLYESSALKNRVQTFFGGCAKYFFRFFRLGLYILLIQLILFFPIAILFGAIFNGSMATVREPGLFTILLIWISLHILVFILITIISDYAKIILVKEDSNRVWSAIWSGTKFTFKKFFTVFPLYLLLFLPPVLLTILYFVIENMLGMRNLFSVLIMFVLQQIFIWIRLFIKFWILGSEFDLFSNYLSDRDRPLLTQEMLLNDSL